MTRLAAVLLLGFLWASSVLAQTGFTSEGATRQRSVESALVAAIRPAGLDSMARVLSAAPHVAGTPGARQVAEEIAWHLRQSGVENETVTYDVLLSWPRRVEVELVAPRAVVAVEHQQAQAAGQNGTSPAIVTRCITRSCSR